MVTFNERCAPTSRKYVAQQGIAMTDLLEKLKFLWLHTSVYAQQKQQLNLNFRSFLKSKHPFVATFEETCALTSRKYVFEPGKSITNSAENFRIFWSHSSVFTLVKQQ